MIDLRLEAERIVDRKIKFYRNFGSYLFVNTILFIVNYIYTPEFWWVSFPAFFWGIGVFVDFMQAFVFTDHDYRERKIEEEMEKMSL